jgi:hypothetical protein
MYTNVSKVIDTANIYLHLFLKSGHQKIKAQNEVILKMLAKQQGLTLSEVSKDVESIYAQKVLDNSPILDEIINKALGES